MSDDLSTQMILSIVIFLCGGLLSVVIGITVLCFDYMNDYAEKYVWAVAESEMKSMISAFSQSPDNPMTGGLIYKLMMNTGLVFDSVVLYDVDGNLVNSISINDADYSEERMLQFATSFVDSKNAEKVYKGEIEYIYESNLYAIRIWEVDLDDR